MLNNVIFAAVDGNQTKQYGTAAILSIVAVILVFAILAAIIGITYGISVGINKAEEKTGVSNKSNNESNSSANPLNLADEDATVAALIASIECRNETKKNVRVISVKEIK